MNIYDTKTDCKVLDPNASTVYHEDENMFIFQEPVKLHKIYMFLSLIVLLTLKIVYKWWNYFFEEISSIKA